ncbi:MAG TPA: surface carbohydrate biosynthesis protein [Limnobacter sp.]|uniref:surface carbohydrate biosynthesis protein n=1 Tax=Limnobacter sp. TaxID=2003368 RepID=UPI002E2EB08B|nr:surface carbohydrate biosynthesis protein [Limnobacter sp.]HEX5485813.1 surface carbohydrate biosynthesis protein [Limnobacter sp.]
MVLKVGLIVDNPLRDLEGLVLLAYQLAKKGHDCWLVPMYDQTFDVRAIGLDYLVLNYLRPNNVDHAKLYMLEGVKVAVLDTEGMAGRSAEEFAGFVNKTGFASKLNAYFVWGESQFRAVLDEGAVPKETLFLTGCPRYDFCAEPWRKSLPPRKVDLPYVLVNTNFALTNPRFSAGTGTELQNMLKVGFSEESALRFVQDAKLAQNGMIELVQYLVEELPELQFVLRPHPFENTSPYEVISHRGNFQIRQESTSVEWVNHALALLHLNCSTALEARMLGVPAITPAWLDTDEIRIPGPHAVSMHCQTREELLEVMSDLSRQDYSRDLNVQGGDELLRQLYFRIDGKASERVCEAILDTAARPANRMDWGRPSIRTVWLTRFRGLMGYRLFSWLLGVFNPQKRPENRAAKYFSVNQVGEIVQRLYKVDPLPKQVNVSAMNEAELPSRKMASGRSICIHASLGDGA